MRSILTLPMEKMSPHSPCDTFLAVCQAICETFRPALNGMKKIQVEHLIFKNLYFYQISVLIIYFCFRNGNGNFSDAALWYLVFFDAQKMLISTFCMRDASVLPEKLLFDNIDGTCTTKEICILPSVLPDIICLVTLMQHTQIRPKYTLKRM